MGCPRCGDPAGVHVITGYEWQGDGYMRERVEFVWDVECNCGCELTDAELERALDSEDQIEDEPEEREEL